MSDTKHHRRLRVWRFHCPECGFGDQEITQLATDDEVYCEICIIAPEEPRRVLLRRWYPEEPAPKS